MSRTFYFLLYNSPFSSVTVERKLQKTTSFFLFWEIEFVENQFTVTCVTYGIRVTNRTSFLV